MRQIIFIDYFAKSFGENGQDTYKLTYDNFIGPHFINVSKFVSFTVRKMNKL